MAAHVSDASSSTAPPSTTASNEHGPTTQPAAATSAAVVSTSEERLIDQSVSHEGSQSMSSDLATTSSPAPVRFGRRSTRGLLLGLSTARCISAGAAVVALVTRPGCCRRDRTGGQRRPCGCRCWRPPSSLGRASPSVSGFPSWRSGRPARLPGSTSTGLASPCHVRPARWPFPATPPRCASTRTLRAPPAWCTTRTGKPSRSPSPLPTRPTCCSRPATSRAG